MEDMMTDIKNALTQQLKSLDWLDEDTKREALHKLDKMSHVIGYPNFITNSRELDAYYDDLKIEENDLYANILAVGKKYMKDHMNGTLDLVLWSTLLIAQPNAIFYNQKNSMIFPAGLILRPFIEVGRPKSMNYGAYGFVIGHEMIHGFDIQGMN